MTKFNFTFQPGLSLAQSIGLETAGKIWSQFLSDDIEVNIHVAMTDELPIGVIGGAIPVYADATVTAVQEALVQEVISADDAIATQNLNVQINDDGVLRYSGLVGERTQQSSQMTITQANAKALGIPLPASPSSALDGYIVLNTLNNSRYSWDYDYARTTPAAQGRLDFLSVVLHEMGHILGFTSAVDGIDGDPEAIAETTLLDLFRYSDRSLANDAQELTIGESAYFSIDGGQTRLASFSEGITPVLGGIEGYQASHWHDNALTPIPNAASEVSDRADFVTDFLVNLFDIAPPATAADQVDDINLLLADPMGQSALTTLRIDERGTGGTSLGIMDPALAPGERSAISALDVLAMDVLGYDPTGASTNLNYRALLADAEATIAQKLGLSIEALGSDLVDTTALTQDRWSDILAVLDQNGELYERRRKRRKRKSKTLWQEEGLDPTVLNIISDGAGAEAEIQANRNQTWITTVEALPYASLFLRTVNLVGDDKNDLIIPAYDQYQTIRAGDGDNVVQLGHKGGTVMAGSGHDTIMAMGGGVTVEGGDGDNVVVLSNPTKQKRTVRTGNGHDYIHVAGDSVTLTTGAGNDVVVAQAHTNTFNVGGTIAATAGNNIIQAERYYFLDVATGAGNDTMTLSGNEVNIVDDGGTNIIDVESDNELDITTGSGNDTLVLAGNYTYLRDDGGDNVIYSDSTMQGEVETGTGNDTLVLTGRYTTLTDDGGDNSIYVNSPTIQIATGDGNDSITVDGAFVTIQDNGGHNTILGDSENGRADIVTGGGDDTITITGSSVSIKDSGGNNTIHVDGHSSRVTTGAGTDVLLLTGNVANVNTGKGDDIILATTTKASIMAGYGNDYIVAGAQSDTVEAGAGDDIISGTDSHRAGGREIDTIYTGSGRDIVILGDRHHPYYTANGGMDYAFIIDFSAMDQLQLHGDAADYRLTYNQVYYRNEVIARFMQPIRFTLDSDQVYFVNETASALDRSVPDSPVFANVLTSGGGSAALDGLVSIPDIMVPAPDAPPLSASDITVPTVEEMLNRVQAHHTTAVSPTYSIVGGNDAQFFTINQNTGDLGWKTMPTGSTPLDANGDNKYDVVVQATAGNGNAERDIDTQRLTIAMQDTASGTMQDTASGTPEAIALQTLTGRDGVVDRFDLTTFAWGSPTADRAGAKSSSPSVWIENIELALDTFILKGTAEQYGIQSQSDHVQLIHNTAQGAQVIAALANVQSFDLTSAAVEYV